MSGSGVTPSAAVKGPAMSAGDLAELMRAFNEVTVRLEATHETLRGQVQRLTRELQAANEQVARSKRLAALGEMAAGIAHEVRNPLGSIRLYAQLLDQDLARMPEQQKLAGKIGDAARALEAVVGDVLTFAKELRLQREGHEGRVLFEQALDQCRAEVERLGVRVVMEGEREVRGDGTLLVQALVNVMRNAVEAMGEKKDGERVLRLRVEGRRMARTRASVEECTVLMVRDTGPGMGDEVVERMFNPFFTTRASGTGLGLAIVHRIVDAHGGRIVVQSEPGVGTEFEIVLPEGGERENAGVESPGELEPVVVLPRRVCVESEVRS